MSTHIEIVTSLSPAEVERQFKKGRLGPVTFSSLEHNPRTGWGGVWDYGVFSIRTLNREAKDELRDRFDLPKMLTLVRFFCDVRDQGQDLIYQMTVTALKEWPGDLGLLLGGDDLAVKRVGGEVSLYKNCIDDKHFALFQQPYEVVES